MPSEAELLGAVLENVLEIIGSARDEDDARARLAPYRSLLTNPEQLQGLLADDHDEADSIEEAIRLAEAASKDTRPPDEEDTDEDAADLFGQEHAEEGDGGPDAHEPFYETGWGYRLARRYGAADRGPDC